MKSTSPTLKVCLLCLTTLFGLGLSVGKAELLVFDFATKLGTNQQGLDLDGLAAGPSTVFGNTGSLTISASASSGTLNYTASDPNFGINAAGTDTTDAFDDVAGTPDVMTFSFTASKPGAFTLVSVDFDRITGAGLASEDAGLLDFSGGGSYPFNGSIVNGSGLLLVGEIFTSGQSITLSWVDGNGFGLEAITINAIIPEPQLGFLVLLALALLRRFRRA